MGRMILVVVFSAAVHAQASPQVLDLLDARRENIKTIEAARATAEADLRAALHRQPSDGALVGSLINELANFSGELKAVEAQAQAKLQTTAADSTRRDTLQTLSASVQALSAKVSPSVVQVLVTGYTTTDEGDGRQTDLVIGRHRSLGSGVIVDRNGYVVTNAHVVQGARRVQVVLQTPDRRGRTVDATVVGATRELDLALLKIDEHDLPALRFAKDGDVQQGQLVFAFGSPQGMRDTMTMGVVSARERQTDADNPVGYIQTDAPINRGNSGGPLVNASGDLIGINTFILSDSGGSQGLGFAVPSSLVAMAVPKLQQYGRLHRGRIGVLLQTMTPALAEGLGIPCESGAIVSDVESGSPADVAGLHVGDVIVNVDGEAVDSVLPVARRLFTSNGDERIRLRYRRGEDTLTADVPVVPEPNDLDRLTDKVDPDNSIVPLLGIMGVSLTPEIAQQLTTIRFPLGVVVAARAPVAGTADVTLVTGDIIHAVNGEPVKSVDQLRSILDGLRPRRPVVLQIERNGQFSFLTFDMD